MQPALSLGQNGPADLVEFAVTVANQDVVWSTFHTFISDSLLIFPSTAHSK